jgi:hypothetical protein
LRCDGSWIPHGPLPGVKDARLEPAWLAELAAAPVKQVEVMGLRAFRTTAVDWHANDGVDARGRATADVEAARFARTLARFDALNAEDPRRDALHGGRPCELAHAERVSAMLERLVPDASEALRLAVRCHHLERWKLPRHEYPATRTGYHQWRIRLRGFHAERAAEILREEHYDEATIARVGALVRKERLRSDPEAQALEDAIALVFLESELAQFVAAHADYDAARLGDILVKTGRKMSARARAFALCELTLERGSGPLVHAAMKAASETVRAAPGDSVATPSM